MPSALTPNISLELPANGSFDDDWDVPVNGNFTITDTVLGGNVGINVTGQTGTIALGLAFYQPRNIIFSGILTANLTYVLPAGVGGTWSLANECTGAFILTFGVSGGGSLQLAAGLSTLVTCDGVNIRFADNAPATAALAGAEAYTNTQVTAALATAADASNLTSGTVPNAQLPYPGIGPGVTIAPDPGTVPTGAAGSIWYYY
jgi:hypothetical protein